MRMFRQSGFHKKVSQLTVAHGFQPEKCLIRIARQVEDHSKSLFSFYAALFHPSYRTAKTITTKTQKPLLDLIMANGKLLSQWN